MLTKITMKGVASYREEEEETTLETTAKFNLIYGINGVGKTTISNFLANQNDKDYAKCSVNQYTGKVLVFNQNFIQNNFHIDNEFKGVFSLAEENINAQKVIDTENEKIESNKKEIFKLSESVKSNTSRKNEIQSKFQDKLWNEIKLKYEKYQSLYDICFTGFKNDKKKMVDHLLNIEKKSQPTVDIQKLIKDADIINDDNNTIIAQLDTNINQKELLEIESDNIFKEIIVGNNNSSIANLIKKLSNSDWVKSGLEYINDSESKCPFCQQTISSNLINEITNYFDENYENQISLLNKLSDVYETIIRKIEINKPSYTNNRFIQDNIDRFNLLNLNVNKVLKDNLGKIQQKIQAPNNVVTLSISTTEISELINYLDEINKKINTYNDSINNKQASKNIIKESFWMKMRCEFDNDIIEYHQLVSNITNNDSQLKSEINACKDNINNSKDIIGDNQSKTINISEAINGMNDNLQWFGLSEFTIVPSNENYKYKLSRNGNDTEFKKLSEGEKTIISFLYYIELCKGKAFIEEESNIDKIIVIDDPISSLSHNFIFHIADLIIAEILIPLAGSSPYFLSKLSSDEFLKQETLKKGVYRTTDDKYFHVNNKKTQELNLNSNQKITEYIDNQNVLDGQYNKKFSNYNCQLNDKKFSQVFILTHSLYFMNELIYIIDRNYMLSKVSTQLFRIIKNKKSCSKILTMGKEEIQNDYQAYWQVIKNAIDNSNDDSTVLLANSMRNILEHFFGFIKKDTIDYINSLDIKFQPFKYYMNKKSHSNKISIGQISSDIDTSIFLEAFKLVFEKAGYSEHYDLMINNKKLCEVTHKE